MTLSKITLIGALSALAVTSVVGQLSCVQLNATDLSSCSCSDASLTFTIEGETTVSANTVSGSERECKRSFFFFAFRQTLRGWKLLYLVCSTCLCVGCFVPTHTPVGCSRYLLLRPQTHYVLCSWASYWMICIKRVNILTMTRSSKSVCICSCLLPGKPPRRCG